MAKANAVSGTTVYVAEGAPVPDELDPATRFVGPGAPAIPDPDLVTTEPDSGETADLPESLEPAPVRPNVNAPKADWVTYAVAVDPDLGYDAADALTKADLVKRYGG